MFLRGSRLETLFDKVHDICVEGGVVFTKPWRSMGNTLYEYTDSLHLPLSPGDYLVTDSNNNLERYMGTEGWFPLLGAHTYIPTSVWDNLVEILGLEFAGAAPAVYNDDGDEEGDMVYLWRVMY